MDNLKITKKSFIRRLFCRHQFIQNIYLDSEPFPPVAYVGNWLDGCKFILTSKVTETVCKKCGKIISKTQVKPSKIELEKYMELRDWTKKFNTIGDYLNWRLNFIKNNWISIIDQTPPINIEIVCKDEVTGKEWGEIFDMPIPDGYPKFTHWMVK